MTGAPYHLASDDWPDDDHRARAIRRYLSAGEQAELERRAPRSRTGWLLGRIAAKDSITAFGLGRHLDTPPLTDIIVANDDAGRPVVTAPAGGGWPDLSVTIAHSGAVGVALVAESRPPAARHRSVQMPGIDVEMVERRSPRFPSLTLSPAERELAPLAGDDRDTWLTRTWVVKEAAAKARGRGLRGRPKDFTIDAVDGTRLRVLDRWIATECISHAGDRYVVGWTEIP